MTQLSINKEEFILLRDFINEHCGILLGDEKDYLVESRLSQLALQSGCSSFNEFYFKAKNDTQSGLKDKIVDAMTTNETLWFRDRHPFTILREVLLPGYAEQKKSGKWGKFKIWSAACSTGQEPYFFAMTILDFCRREPSLSPADFQILATDISPSALFLAINAKYDNIAIKRGLAPEQQERYFQKEGRIYSLRDKVKSMVTFKKFNLQNDFSILPKCDIILCRYVAIYFSDALKRELFYKFSNTLAPEGSLFLGATETINNYSNQYLTLNHNKGMYYRVRNTP